MATRITSRDMEQVRRKNGKKRKIKSRISLQCAKECNEGKEQAKIVILMEETTIIKRLKQYFEKLLNGKENNQDNTTVAITSEEY